jgi:hypothetical protein
MSTNLNPTVSSNTRATRSRFSSPAIAGGNGATDPSSRAPSSGTGGPNGTNGLDGQKQTLLQRWLEPPVQVKASFLDAGLVRQGVFENMAPLGTLPKVGLFKKTAPPPAAAPEHTPVRRIIVKQKSVLPSTPVLAPPPPPPPAPEEDETEADETEEEDDGKTEDQNDGTLGGKGRDEAADKEDHGARATSALRRARRSVTAGETDDEEWAPGTSAQKPRTRPSVSRASTAQLQQPAAASIAGSRPVTQKEFIDKVVEAAVGEALTHFRYPTAWALRTLYDENSSNQEFLDMIQKVFLQTANADELEDFARRIQTRKTQGKKHNQAFHYFVPPSPTNSQPAPHPPKRSPYANLVKFDISTLRLDQDSSKPVKRERSATVPEPEPERDAEPEPEPELPPRKKRKAGRQQHSEATPSSSTKMAANGANGKANAETPSRKRTRARSVSSISSLSSARSLTPPPDDIQEDGEDDGFDETPSRTSPAPPPRPITTTTRRRSNAPRKSRNVSPSRPSPAASTIAQQSASAATPSQPSQRQSPAVEAELPPYEMPAVVDSPMFPNLNSKKGKSGNPALIIATKLGKIDPKDRKLRFRQQARDVTNQSFPVRDVRELSPQPASEPEAPQEEEAPVRPATPAAAPASRLRASLPSNRGTPAPREGRSTRSSRKRTHDDLDDQPSPLTANFPGSEAASTVADSRAGTPALRAAKKPRTGLRVKNS